MKPGTHPASVRVATCPGDVPRRATVAYEELRKNGMEVVIPSAAEIAAFREKTRPVYDRWVGEVGVDLVKAAEQIVAKTK